MEKKRCLYQGTNHDMSNISRVLASEYLDSRTKRWGDDVAIFFSDKDVVFLSYEGYEELLCALEKMDKPLEIRDAVNYSLMVVALEHPELTSPVYFLEWPNEYKYNIGNLLPNFIPEIMGSAIESKLFNEKELQDILQYVYAVSNCRHGSLLRDFGRYSKIDYMVRDNITKRQLNSIITASMELTAKELTRNIYDEDNLSYSMYINTDIDLTEWMKNRSFLNTANWALDTFEQDEFTRELFKHFIEGCKEEYIQPRKAVFKSNKKAIQRGKKIVKGYFKEKEEV